MASTPVFSYLTIEAASTGSYKEKGSKFLAFAYPVVSETDIKLKIEGLKKEYFDAGHHCFAWILGPGKMSFRAYDDGEPNHSAGDPILGQIRSNELTNTLIVVVRYFGGVKLGVGGLIAAYKTAAADALKNCVIVEREVVEEIKFFYDYSATPEVMRTVKEFDLTIIQQDFSTSCMLTVAVALRRKDALLEKIKLMIALGLELKIEST